MRLRNSSKRSWNDFVLHPFVIALGNGSLPEQAFRHYLMQDYLFLIDFARVWGLATYKSKTLEDIETASINLKAILEVEIKLHVEYCEKWGINQCDLESTLREPETSSYINYVMNCGLEGSLLDLHVALAPCIIGYGEIGSRLNKESYALPSNPYSSWIKIYSGPDYQNTVIQAVDTLERLSKNVTGEEKYLKLTKIFNTATKLEKQFWDMGMRNGPSS